MSPRTESSAPPHGSAWRRVHRVAALFFTVSACILLGSSPHAALPTTPISTPSVPYTNTPVTTTATVAPLVMLVVSRDEQLSIKAYTDYTDLDGDGIIDSTYNDNFTYQGYFGSGLCYTNSTKLLFAAAASGTGTNGHQCSAQWSGNFLNWLTMTRMDIVRYVLFGGKRSVDTSLATVLQRAYLPDDTHSFQKVYAGSDINLYTPYSTYPMSFCNTTDVNSSTAYTTGYNPLLRVAQGSFPEWAATEVRQCDWRDAAGSSNTTDQPLSTATGSDQLVVLVNVCSNASFRESFCRPYVNGTTTTYKPAGLLQQYGEASQMRFGLTTGTYDHSRTGGYVRRNIGQIYGNDNTSITGCATGDEINFKNGSFCNQTAGAEGIINTLQRLQIMMWPNSPSSSSNNTYSDCAYPTNRGSGNGLSGSPSTDSSGGNRQCTDWGNPLAEIYGEALRYIEGNGNTPTSGFIPNGSYDSKLGLPTSVAWSDPYSASNYCASCSVIVLSTGFGSFDSDEIPAIPYLGDASAAAATTRLGTIEQGLTSNVIGNDVIGYYGATPTQTGSADITASGSQPSTANAVCSSKAVGDLALVRGVCPEQPNTEGSYQIAGLAFDAWTNDLRPQTALTGMQRAKTYTVSLASTLPSLRLATSGGTLVVSPLCKNYAGSDPTTTLPVTGPTTGLTGTVCTLNDVTVQPLTSTSTTVPFAGTTFGIPTRADGKAGSLVLVWEDQPWGSDHDRDIIEMLSYCVGSACVGTNICQDKVFKTADGTTLNSSSSGPRNACPAGVTEGGVGSNQVLIRTEMISASTGNSMRAGFSVTGSTNDGAYATVNHFSSGGDTSSVLTGSQVPYTFSSRLGLGNAPVVVSLTAGTALANSLQNPLFYAAKYGGFQYANGTASPTPGTQSQWDQVDNNTGLPATSGPCVPGDCIPDNYFPVSNPAQLQSQLSKVFSTILAQSASGSAAAVVGTSRKGQGVVYQALFENQHADTTDSTKIATWIGSVQALFQDSQGRFREDGTGTGKGTLNESSLAANPVVTIFYDSVSQTTQITRDSGSGPVVAALSSLNPIWNARDVLASLPSVAQRSYSANASTGRYIFTFLDYNQNGLPSAGEVVPFTAAQFPTSGASNWGILNINNSAAASDLISYIRGTDGTISGQPTRNRTIRYYSTDTVPKTMRLGDIVDSSPAVETAPADNYDVTYNDASYGAYYDKYRNRRSVVYVGANDGMLHAFNGGFFDPSALKFNLKNSGGSETTHPLGAELWAYIPYNLLPHLTWLTDPSYGHVWYVDGSPRTFDARIFANDATHPNGWGTVLVAGFRFGGGPLTLNPPDDNALNKFGVTKSGSGGTATSLSTRSAYVVMDITDPESPPTLIAEISGASLSDTRLNYTTSFPTAAVFKGSATGDVEKWYLAFGTGPNNYEPATSSNNAGLYLYDLGSGGTVGGFVSGYSPYSLPGASNSFAGDPVTVDWNTNYKVDSLYVGTIGTTITSGAISAQSGQLYKLNFKDSSTPTNWSAPVSLLNPGNPVVETPQVALDEGGHHWVLAGTGRFFAQADKVTTLQQSLFGVIDTLDATPATTPSYSSLIDTTNALVQTNGTITGVTGSASQTALVANAVTAGGWKLNLKVSTTTAAERVYVPTLLAGDVLFANAYTPSGAVCTAGGTSEQYGLYYKTGTARADIPTYGTTTSSGNTYVTSTTSQGSGAAATSSIDTLPGTGGAVVIDTQNSTGAINQTPATLRGTLSNAEVDWRETHPTYTQ